MFELTQDIYMDQSLLFADQVQHQFSAKLTNENRGVKQAGFLVLRQSSMPSVLIETGFLSNKNEANFLNSNVGQSTIANSIFEAFRTFKTKKSAGNTTIANNTSNTSTEGSKKITAKQPEKINI